MKDQPKSKLSPFQILLQAVEDPYIIVKLKFEYVAGKLNKYPHGFETDQPVVPFLNGTLLELKKQPNFKKSTSLKFYKETCGFLAAITPT